MIKINTNDGKTHKIDLSDENQAKEWIPRIRSQSFQKTITGMSVVEDVRSRVRCPCCNSPGDMFCRACKSEIADDFRTSVGVQYNVSKPSNFSGRILFAAEQIPADSEAGIRGGERITCFAGDTRLQMMVHAGQPSMRITLTRTGRLVASPLFE